MQKKALIILTPGFPKNEEDVNCLPLQQSLVKALSKNFIEVETIVLSFIYPFVKKEYWWNNTQVFAFNGKAYRGPLKFFLWRSLKKKLRQLAEEKEIIGLLSFWCGEAAWVAKQFATEKKLPHYCWLLGQDSKKENRWVKKIQPRGKELLAISDFIQKEFEKNHGIQPARVISPGIDVDLFPKKTITERTIDVMAAGSLIPLKQHEVFIDIIAELKNKLPHIKAVICGKGPLQKKLAALIKTKGLTTHIELKGELPYVEVLELMSRSKLFLHTSGYEGFAMVCAEALYAGCPLISFTRPMNKPIQNWIIVNTKEEIIKTAISLLEENKTFNSVLVKSIDEVAKEMLSLFF